MLKERLTAAREVRATFLTAEEAQDAAAIHAVKCVLAALEQRVAANLPLDTGIDAIRHLGRAAQLALEARNELILAHPELAKLPAQLGIERMVGDVGACPAMAEQGVELRIVA